MVSAKWCVSTKEKKNSQLRPECSSDRSNPESKITEMRLPDLTILSWRQDLCSTRSRWDRQTIMPTSRNKLKKHTSHSYFLHNFHQDEEGSSLVCVLLSFLSFFLIPFLTNFGQDKSLFNAHLQKDPRFARKMHGKNSHLFRDFWEENAFIVWCCLWNSCLNRKICFIVGIRARWRHAKNAHKFKKEGKLLKIILCAFSYLRTPHACVKNIKN